MKNSVGCGKPSVSLNMNNPLEHTSRRQYSEKFFQGLKVKDQNTHIAPRKINKMDGLLNYEGVPRFKDDNVSCKVNHQKITGSKT